MEPEPRPILNAWATPTMVTRVPRLGKSLQIPSTISEKSNEDHDTQFKKWCDDMLEQAGPEHNPPQETPLITVDSSEHHENFPHDPWNLPFPTCTPFDGRSEVEAQLNAPKLMNFLGMPTTTTMLVKLKGDPESAERLRSFFNNELTINLDTLHEAPVELHARSHSPKVDVHKFTPTKNDLVDPDPKSLFKLRTLGDYFESDESNAVLPVVCKGNAILGVLDGEAGVSIVTKRCWEKMGQPQMDVADLRVKLANGGLVRALGLLRNLRVKILDHYVAHTFPVMDFNDKPRSFKMILGRPFMREHKMVHNWSNNHVYLNLKDEHVRVNLPSEKAHPLAHGYFRVGSDMTVFRIGSHNLCKLLQNVQERDDPKYEDYIHDDDPVYDRNWCHLLSTVDI